MSSRMVVIQNVPLTSYAVTTHCACTRISGVMTSSTAWTTATSLRSASWVGIHAATPFLLSVLYTGNVYPIHGETKKLFNVTSTYLRLGFHTEASAERLRFLNLFLWFAHACVSMLQRVARWGISRATESVWTRCTAVTASFTVQSRTWMRLQTVLVSDVMTELLAFQWRTLNITDCHRRFWSVNNQGGFVRTVEIR